jgi:hypothetical protein
MLTMGSMLTMERLLSMWGLGMALVTTAFISAVAARQSWLIATNGGLLLVAFAQGGIGGWLGKLLFWTGLAMVGIGLWRGSFSAWTALPEACPGGQA